VIVTGTILGAAATLIAILCLASLRQQRATARRQRAEVLSMINRQREETAQQISEVSRAVEALNESRQSIEAACGDGFPLSRRRDAIRLLRSGVSPETAASSLGIATREMLLIAKVSRILTVD
jgi:hypothetical protein